MALSLLFLFLLRPKFNPAKQQTAKAAKQRIMFFSLNRIVVLEQIHYCHQIWCPKSSCARKGPISDKDKQQMHLLYICFSRLRVQQRQSPCPFLYDGWLWVGGCIAIKMGSTNLCTVWMGNLRSVWTSFFFVLRAWL